MAETGNQTIHAQQAFEFADVFSYKFKDRALGKPPRQLRLKEPDGPSTGGGKQARQSMVLRNEAGDAVVCGWVDLANRTAELRGFAYISEQFKARRGHIIDIKQEEYEALLSEVQRFLDLHKLQTETVAQRASGTAPTTPTAVPMWPLLAAAVLVGVLVGYLLFT